MCLKHKNKFNQNENKGSTKNKVNQFITPSNYHNFLLGEMNPNHKGIAFYNKRVLHPWTTIKPLPNFQTSNPGLNRKKKEMRSKDSDSIKGYEMNLKGKGKRGVEGGVEQRRRQDRAWWAKVGFKLKR